MARGVSAYTAQDWVGAVSFGPASATPTFVSLRKRRGHCLIGRPVPKR